MSGPPPGRWCAAVILTLALFIPASAQQYLSQEARIAGGYSCSGSVGIPAQKLVLFANSRWNTSTLDIKAFRVQLHQARGSQGSGQFVVSRNPELHGRFEVKGDKLLLYTLHPSFFPSDTGHTGAVSRFAKPIPDALSEPHKVFRIDWKSGRLIEMLPYNARRKPLVCQPGELF